MIIPIIVGVLGLMVGGRNKPLSNQKKTTMLGPTSGFLYKVEDIPDSQIVIVHAPDGATATFNRDGEKRLRFKVARGNQGTIDIMRRDFEPVRLVSDSTEKTG